MIDQGLLDLQPEFQQPMLLEKSEWADKVSHLREAFYPNTAEPQPATQKELEAVVEIAQLFGTHWRLQMAANLICLLPHQSEDPTILQAFTGALFTRLAAPHPLVLNELIAKAKGREDYSPSKTKILAYDTLPKVQQFDEIMRSIRKLVSKRE